MAAKILTKSLISLCFQDKRVCAFKAEIQDGRQKWRENNFWEKTEDTLRVKNFCRNRSISLLSEINAFFCILRRNSRWPPKVAGKRFLQKVASRLYKYHVGQKFSRNCSISLCFRDKCVFAFSVLRKIVMFS